MHISMKRNYAVLAYIMFIAACSGNVPVKNGDVNIVYETKGKGDTAIVFVHGWCINKEYWQPQMNFFEKQYKLVALDLGGHGESGENRRQWTVDEYANDVIAVINALQLNKVILVGHSMGGDIILQVANKIPGKIVGFIGIDNFKDIVTGFTPEEQKGIDDFFSTLRSNYDSIAALYCRSTLFPQDYTDSVSVNRVIKDVQHMDTTVAIQTLESLLAYSLKETEQLPLLKMPVHLVVSDFTPTNEDAVKNYCTRGLHVYTVKGTGHYPMIEKRGEFNLKLQQALNDISKGR